MVIKDFEFAVPRQTPEDDDFRIVSSVIVKDGKLCKTVSFRFGGNAETPRLVVSDLAVNLDSKAAYALAKHLEEVEATFEKMQDEQGLVDALLGSPARLDALTESLQQESEPWNLEAD